MATALSIVQRFFPQVEKVVDGTKRITVHVSKEDSKRSTTKNHNSCAFATACKEQEKADGVIVSVKNVYIIKGNRAYRYYNLESTSREIVSFDREAGFEPGDYQLKPPGEYNSLEGLRERAADRRSGDRHRKPRKEPQFVHRTTNIRTSLGGGGVV